MNQPHIKTRPTGKIPTTDVTNELANALNSLGGVGVGDIPSGGITRTALLRPTGSMTGGGFYFGVVLLGPFRADGSQNLDLPGNMLDGPKCIVVKLDEINTNLHGLSTADPIPGILIGYSKDDHQYPIFVSTLFDVGNPQYQFMGLQGVAQNQRGWGFIKAHPMET